MAGKGGFDGKAGKPKGGCDGKAAKGCGDGKAAKGVGKPKGGAGGGKSLPQPAAAPVAFVIDGIPVIQNMTLPPTCKLVQEGFPAVVPAIVWESADIFSSAGTIVQEMTTDFEIVDDPEWTIYPDVAKLVTTALGQEFGICVVKSPQHKICALGIACGRQGRERSGKLALTVALAAGTDKMAYLSAAYPAFGRMCTAAGLESKSYGAVLTPAAAPGAAAVAAVPGPGVNPLGLDGPEIKFIRMPHDATICQRGLGSDAPVVSYGSKAYKSFFSNVSPILYEFLGYECKVSDWRMMEIEDDGDWKQFPDIAHAIRALGLDPLGMTIAMHRPKGVWGVGLSGSIKTRQQAAKMALVVALFQKHIGKNAEKIKELMTTFPEFAELMETTDLELPVGPSDKKRRRLGLPPAEPVIVV